MFTHVFVGANDVAATKAFYDGVMQALGHGEGALIKDGAAVAYASKAGSFIAGLPRNGEPASGANGGTIGLHAASPEAVDAAYAAGLANGGTDEGAPGPREAFPGSYGAYLFDPSGNKLCLWHVAG
ncbi:VOC family protein [Croceicoccus bisphenolivorans]|uniref:VOC family protein n=1 Tax=Croceicoccus bisphenolivorans TaxID=1783232 RepID=UPI00082B4C69|nr:VOC family protein [Croceicoccus bisphenolivorans]